MEIKDETVTHRLTRIATKVLEKGDSKKDKLTEKNRKVPTRQHHQMRTHPTTRVILRPNSNKASMAESLGKLAPRD